MASKSRKFIATGLSAAVVASAVAPVASAATTFTDVPANAWYGGSLANLVEKNIIGGVGGGKFAPDQAVTREQLAKMLVYALELDINEEVADPGFSDAKPGDWYYKAVAVAKAHGVLNGVGNGKFGAGSSLTREQMATAIVNAFKLRDKVDGSKVEIPYTDLDGNAYRNDVAILYSYGILADGTAYNPKEVVDRKGFVAFLDKTLTKLPKVEEPKPEPPTPPTTGITIKSAEARSSNAVTLVLSDAPLVNLTKDDISIAGATVEGVTTTDNVVTVYTSAPLEAGKEYTVTYKGSSVKFTAVTLVGQQNVEAVQLMNKRQIKVSFKNPVLWDANVKNLGNYYMNLLSDMGDRNGNLADDSIAAAANGKWTVTAGSQEIKKDKDGNEITGQAVSYVIIESTNGEQVDALGLKYNESANIQVRNVKDAATKGYINTSEATLKVEDKVAPSVVGMSSVVYTDNNKLVITFDEPVKSYNENHRMLVSINNNVVAAEIASTTGSVADHKKLVVDLAGLDLEKDVAHTVKVVGAMDLHENVNTGTQNPYVGTFTLKAPEVKPPTPEVFARPSVTGIQQIADNKFTVTFDQAVTSFDASKPVVTFKKSDFQSGEWTDITVAESDVVKSADGKVWTVTLDANLNKAEADNGSEDLNYDGQDQAIRDVVVENYYPTNVKATTAIKDADKAYYVGTTYSKSLTLKHDTVAPVIGTKGGFDTAGNLYIPFVDAPWDGIIQKGAGKLTVSKTNSKGVTSSYDVDVANAKVTILGANTKLDNVTYSAGKTVVVDVDNFETDAVYTVAFTAGSITDANRAGEIKVTPQSTGNLNAIKESNISITVPKPVTTPAPSVEGLVPQTTKGLIYSGHDIWDFAGGVYAGSASKISTIKGNENTVGSYDYMQLPENREKIVVVFDGEVLESSALNKNNYTVNGKKLDQKATVTYHIAEDLVTNGSDTLATVLGNGGVAGKKVGFVVITLPQDSIDRDGLYTVKVEGITNKSGKSMLPVTANVSLHDNTLPTATSAKLKGTKQLEVTFNEDVIADVVKAKNNFEVSVNGIKYQVVDVDYPDYPKYTNKLLLTLAQDITLNGDLSTAKLSVKVKKDVDGNMWVWDYDGTLNGDGTGFYDADLANPAREVTVSN
ncbi:S-layer homology domain-containing protein [Fictibacillus sp. BK138]|uniref:S-layer homology domain-containing protein n=1 Tax=Fictibacillus sp. BK138 TaxID=2512121 RepID=UPI001028C7CD|nr:S-layer homology domain-containing protein [Fictibacillus sp. BK138]RZT21534.1 S-layer family protein [Fictibacillus sp. BK138]